MASGATGLPVSFATLRDRIEDVLREELEARRQELAWIDPGAADPLDEIVRLVEGGGRRVRPAFCYWGFRAAGGADGEPILKAAAAFELLHTMALIHDDVMDAATERRGLPSSHVVLAEAAAARGSAEPGRLGTAVAILAGDLAAVLADRMLLGAGFPPGRLVAALDLYHRMRLETAAGQYLDLVGARIDPHRLARLKGGAYTVEGPLRVGAALAGAVDAVDAALRRYGEPLGEAFQLLDDLRDGDAANGVAPGDVHALVVQARAALDTDVLDPTVVEALAAMAELVTAG